MDCIDNQGNCFIVYWAKVDLFLIRFVYSGLVFCDEKGFTTEKSTLRKTCKPIINGSINFYSRYFTTDVMLKRMNDPIICSLYKDNQNNELIWNCHHPKALSEIKYNNNIYKGLGYAETLFSLIKPWNLPIDELRWGRFLSDIYTVIWIYWKGEFPINKLFFDGVEYNDAVFNDDLIIFGNGIYQLKFLQAQVIRQGKLSGLFSKMKLLKPFFNRKILNTVEIKYKSRTALSKNSIVLSTDWSLFETVTWGK